MLAPSVATVATQSAKVGVWALVAALLAPSLMGPSLVHAAEPTTFARLIDAKSLKCVFGPSAVVENLTGIASLAMPRMKKDGGLGTLHFDAIDWRRKSARVIGGGGAPSLAAWVSVSGLHFIEETGSGNVVFTSVFAQATPEGFRAVSSRHMDIFRTLMPSQHSGTCKVWE
jgi:hypothetical protein